MATWHEVDAATLARWDTETVTPRGMHDERVDTIVENAFNGMGDSAGDDEFGVSCAWIDLADHLEEYGHTFPSGVDYWSLGAYLTTAPGMSGERFALAYIDANGCRFVVGYATHGDMMQAYRDFENAVAEWENS